MRPFLPSCLITVLALVLSFLWAGWQGLIVCGLLMVMEISFSFDNAVVNASVMHGMSVKWQRRFLTWGMLIATFGMYYLFPIIIVSAATGLNIAEATHLAIASPEIYSRHLMNSHAQIASFGGMFLLMVFLHFILDESKKLHWLGAAEKALSRLGKLESVEILIALLLLLLLQSFLPQTARLPTVAAGTVGVMLYVFINSLTALFGFEKRHAAAGRSALMRFIYLNILDASFSLDAVVGSFAISTDIVLIMLGLSAGAMFVRSLTIQLVDKGTLKQYIFLEHGAHYAIGALAAIMLISIVAPIPEAIPGLVGIFFILASFLSSVRHNRQK